MIGATILEERNVFLSDCPPRFDKERGAASRRSLVHPQPVGTRQLTRPLSIASGVEPRIAMTQLATADLLHRATS